MKFYRLRSMNGLLAGYNELENQSIYFASPQELNDPMEGYRHFFWSGDRIAWNNLLRHYLFCLDRACALLTLTSKRSAPLSMNDLPLFAGRNDFPTEEYRDRFRKVENDFLGSESIQRLLDGVVRYARDVRGEELQFYLTIAHFAALESIAKINDTSGVKFRRGDNLSPIDVTATGAQSDLFEILSKLSRDGSETTEAVEALFQGWAHMQMQLGLINLRDAARDSVARSKHFVACDFSTQYVKALERLAFPDWYTACFMSECSNSSVWGHYGANHTGACLIFESQEIDGRHCLSLTGYNSVSNSGRMKGRMSMQLHPVTYAEGYARIDFFRSIGRLPLPTLNSTWYRDEEGNASACSLPLLADQASWREMYWQNFLGDLLRKTKDWSYENEYRLVLNGELIDYSDTGCRTLNYEFSALKGLIFGARAKPEDKLEVMRIIESKCAKQNRTDFRFYQAFYSPRTERVEHAALSLTRTNA